MIDKEPIFKSIFANDWDALPPVMHKHYANKPFSNDQLTLSGKMDLMCKWYIMPIFKWMGIFPAQNIKNIDAKVVLKSETDSANFCFERHFYLKPEKAFRFDSKMEPQGGNEMKEMMKFGLAWHSLFSWDGTYVRLTHKAYSLNIGKLSIKLPIEWLVGRSNAWEQAKGEDSFSMSATITHPLLGKIYEYRGLFKIEEMLV